MTAAAHIDPRWSRDWSLPHIDRARLDRLDDDGVSSVLSAIRVLEDDTRKNKLFQFFPDSGPFRRELYRQQMAFFALGSKCRTRCFMAANRTGKTEGGGFEVVLHLTGLYPEWWKGFRFAHPVDVWVAGDTKETVRDITQTKLLGRPGAPGTGMIPGEMIGRVVMRQNSGGSVDYVTVRHVSGGYSTLGFKSYDQGREAFQGTEKHIVWLDEEPKSSGIRSECAMRLGTTGGLLIETFTPLRGITEIVQRYMASDDGEMLGLDADRVLVRGKDVGMVMAGWDDVPHLSATEKERMLAECEPHLVESRSKGIPSLGSGAIYPVPLDEIIADPFDIPPHWPRVYGLDVGWNRTAAVWLAHDRDTDTVYAYAEHYRGQAEPEIHAAAIRARGEWIPGEIDPASRGRGQADGARLFDLYSGHGLRLVHAVNTVEAGILEVYSRLSTGRLKIFRTLQCVASEYRIYRRDEKGKIVKANDHAMDALRYGIMGIVHAVCEPLKSHGIRRPANWRTA